MNWEAHWGLREDPFPDVGGVYVPTPWHEEAVARLQHVVESGGRQGRLEAGAGLGKSAVLREVLRRARGPRWRIARCASPLDAPSLHAELARGLGLDPGRCPGGRVAWKALTDAVRLAGAQGLGVVLAVDDAHLLERADLERLPHLGPARGGRLSVLIAGRPARRRDEVASWELTIRLPPLSRLEAEGYLAARLADAGRSGPAFTPRAITRLHALSGGVPRGLHRLAGLALMAGAVRGFEIVTPELVDAIVPECAAEQIGADGCPIG
jgi:type II secretory pathway predicted ATPase ExeA